MLEFTQFHFAGSNIKFNTLRERQLGRVIDRIRLAAHIAFPSIGATFSTAAGFLLPTKGTADLCARGASSPSMEVLAQIAETLQVPPDWLFPRRTGAGPMERSHVVRAHNRRDLNMLYGEDVAQLGYQDALLSGSIGGNFYMGLAIYEPNCIRPTRTLYQPEGEHHGLVLQGELELQLGPEVITLREGDSYSFPADIPHHAVNRSDEICKLVWAASPVVIPKNAAVKEENE